jgi:predicted nucleic acid-binding protein
MTRYLLDTSILIDYSKNIEPTRSRVLAMIAAGDELCTCAVVVAEFYSGLPPAERPVWDAFLGSFRYLDETWDVAVGAGADRYANARVGRPLAVTDTLIAAAARAAGAVVVTNDVQDFPTTDVQVVSLRP